MSVWLCIPSARPASEIAERLGKWRAMGYKIALWRNGPHMNLPTRLSDYTVCTQEYAGWGASINRLIADNSSVDPSADCFVGGGDDLDPDCTKWAHQIAHECVTHAFELHERQCGGCHVDASVIATFLVMQPTGDRWGDNEPWARAQFPDAPAYIDRICGSPWIGREFARRMNQGKGPFWPEYQHMFADEELQNVAQRMGVLWQRLDLTHHHDHPLRSAGAHVVPDFAGEIYSSEHWQASKLLFDSRKKAGFPGSECIA